MTRLARLRRRSTVTDSGESLLELMMAVAIMGIAVVAIVSGIATGILMSDIHRKQATAGAYVRNYAEAVVAYVASPDYKNDLDYRPGTVRLPKVPGMFDEPTASVKCWTGNQFDACKAGTAVQEVTLTVASTDSRASESLVVIVREP